MPNPNNLPLYFEELKIKEDSTLSLSDLLAQFKQRIPINYLEIKLEEGNYSGSTNPKWKDKPLCERYFFTYQGKEIQLDLPHELMDKLGLEKGEDITQPLYLDPQVLTRKETYKGITIENEKEIILVNPHKLVMKDQEIQTEPNIEKVEEIKKLSEELETQKQNYLDLERQRQGEITELRTQLTEKGQELKKWTNQFPNQQTPETVQEKINSLNIQLTNANNTISQNNSTIASLTTQINSLNSQLSLWTKTFSGENASQVQARISQLQTNYNNANNLGNSLQTQLNTANAALAKERGWWEKWFSNSSDGFISNAGNFNETFYYNKDIALFISQKLNTHWSNMITSSINFSRNNLALFEYNPSLDGKLLFKTLYQYYRDK